MKRDFSRSHVDETRCNTQAENGILRDQFSVHASPGSYLLIILLAAKDQESSFLLLELFKKSGVGVAPGSSKSLIRDGLMRQRIATSRSCFVNESRSQ